MKRTTRLMMAVLVLLMATGLYAQGRGPGAGQGGNPPGTQSGMGPGMGPQSGMPGGGPAALVEYLGLTETQAEQWQALHEDFFTSNQALFDQRRDLQDQLHELLATDNSDAGQVGTLVLSIRGVSDQIRAAHDQLQEDLKALLTPDQVEKFEAFLAARASMGHRGPGGHGPGGANGGRCPGC